MLTWFIFFSVQKSYNATLYVVLKETFPHGYSLKSCQPQTIKNSFEIVSAWLLKKVEFILLMMLYYIIY